MAEGQFNEGPVYGVALIDSVPLPGGSMKQAVPTRDELCVVMERVGTRTVGALEVLLDYYKSKVWPNQGDAFPQRFRYRKTADSRWKFGVAVPHPTDPPTWRIECLNSRGSGGFDDDPWEILGHIIGDVAEFEWIDNDLGWEGLS